MSFADRADISESVPFIHAKATRNRGRSVNHIAPAARQRPICADRKVRQQQSRFGNPEQAPKQFRSIVFRRVRSAKSAMQLSLNDQTGDMQMIKIAARVALATILVTAGVAVAAAQVPGHRPIVGTSTMKTRTE